MITDLGGYRALVVDDELLVQLVIGQALEDAGVAVALAGNGEEALATLEQGMSFDVLVTDITMPGIDGWTLAEQARNLQPGLAVVYVTGASFVPPRQLPGSLLVHKPFRGHDLVRAVSNALHWAATGQAAAA